VVYTDKWLPALPLFYVYAAGIAVGFLSPLVFPAVDATGRPEVNVRFSIAWTVGIAVLAPLLTSRWGSLGFAIGYCVPMVLGNLGIIFVLKRLVPDVHLWPRTRASILAGGAVALTGRFVLLDWCGGAFGLVASVVIAVVIFLGFVALFDRTAIGEIRSLVRRNNS
jgi:O-antigen/teichoic acid export membrane protein